jgi:hypothetical protein
MTIVLTMLAAPEWKKGYAVEVVFVSMVWIIFMVGTFLHRRDVQKAEAANLFRADEEKFGEEEVQVERKF